MLKKSVKKAALASLVAATCFGGPAQAGGLFGDGGLIRGDLGELLDPIENEVTTPLARGIVEWGGAAIGAEMGGPIGGMVGRRIGQEINEGFRGGRRGGFEARRVHPQVGNFCHTPAGRFGPGPINPLGSWCYADTPWGQVEGRVGR